MKVKVKDLPSKIDNLVDKVEHGETVIITREGRPIADLLSLSTTSQGWKRKVQKITLKNGISVRSFIEEERNFS